MRPRKSDWLMLVPLVAFTGFLGYVAKAEPNLHLVERESNIHWKEYTEEELYIEDIVLGPVMDQIEPQMMYYDVPLSLELQEHIFTECEKHNIAPSIIIAMIERESNFKADAMGDAGHSLGLMQIQPKWHKERMERLGCTDLLDPYQNITVGVDIVAELKDKNPELYWVLMAYNGGQAYADRNLESDNISSYALEVMERASELLRVRADEE